jgi:uncharacterized membrane protein
MTPGLNRAKRSLIYSLVGLVLVAVILAGVVSEAAFPLMDSTGIPAGACWVCPVGLLAGFSSLLGTVAGIAALAQLPLAGPAGAQRIARWAVSLGSLGLAVLFALAIYCLIHGPM